MKDLNNTQLNAVGMSEYSLKRFIKRTLKLAPALQKYRLMDVLPSYLNQVVIGLLLSDGSIERPVQTGGARLSVILGIDTLPYLTHLFKLLESLTDSGISHIEVKDKKKLVSPISQYGSKRLCCPCLCIIIICFILSTK